ncbi:MAG: L,D-transpeptidase [Gammaproteobacteria bacterium]|nr:L,D-transpeptidase [Gammaproteobacteria bacterium]
MNENPQSLGLEKVIHAVTEKTGSSASRFIWINVAEQCLYLIDAKQVVQQYAISTSRYGVGNLQDSFKTPLGLHHIAEKLGAECSSGEILKARQATGDLAPICQDAIALDKDYITSRILWLSGLEPGYNQGGQVDSHSRYIYIHGTAEEGLIGRPASIGCIRMRNQDVIKLFSEVEQGLLVMITSDN